MTFLYALFASLITHRFDCWSCFLKLDLPDLFRSAAIIKQFAKRMQSQQSF